MSLDVKRTTLKRKYCIFGCDKLDVHVHRFPHPINHQEWFSSWVAVIGDRLQGDDPMCIYKNKRVCDYHFQPEDITVGRRVVFGAVPSLNLDGVFQTKYSVEGEHSYALFLSESVTNVQGPSLLTNMQESSMSTYVQGPSTSKISCLINELTSLKMVKARKYVVKKHFEGVPKRDDYEIVEQELPPLQDGEILVKTEWVSVDPYLRAYHSRFPLPYDQFGFQVGTVEESKNPKYPVGCRVVSHKGWCDYSVLSEKNKSPNFTMYKMPDMAGLPIELSIGAVGMVGATAYFGFLEICQPKAGETVVVTGAAGAVGSIVGQIAKIKGCKVIGFAGSDDKVEWLEKELGFDKAINYKTADIHRALKEAAPKGVDCYFDNVGGEISSIIMNNMNDFGRVSVCGSISAYNEMDDPSNVPKASIVQPALVFKQLKMEGFLVSRWVDRWPESFADLIKWIKSGDLKTKCHVTEGFENIYDAFVGMLAGDNTGKAVVKI